jgi:hypothetical protein
MRRWWNWAAVGLGLCALGWIVWPARPGAPPGGRAGAPDSPCAAASAPAGRVTTWIVAGQSQATTFGMSRRTLPFRWIPDPEAFVWVWDDERRTGRWEPYAPGVNSAPKGRWGPEAQLIRMFRRDHPDAPLAIIKYAPGQTGVAEDPDQRDWNVHSRGEAWDNLAAMTDAALKTCGLSLDAVFWMGNHNDGMRADKAALTGRNMADLVGASRTLWGPGLRWIVGLPDDTAPFYATVRAGLVGLDRSDPLMTSFDTSRYTTQLDGLHYDAASVIRLGTDFYRGWVRLPPPRAPLDPLR